MIELTASDIYTLLRPNECDLRVYLAHTGAAAAERSPYEEILVEMGIQHEQHCLSKYAEVVDIREFSRSERVARTQEAITEGKPVLYQPRFEFAGQISDTDCLIVGVPDFLILADDKYSIVDAKISRRITKKDHPEIILQMGLYGWLYEQALGHKPVDLEVVGGDGETTTVECDDGAVAKALSQIVELKKLESAPACVVGWSRCSACPYSEICWPAAVEREDVGTVVGVDKGLVTQLRSEGISTARELLNKYDGAALTELKRPWGTRMQKVGKKAGRILLSARAVTEERSFLRQAPAIPSDANFVMFDLEGIPPHLDESGKIYMWGIQVFGEEPGPFDPAMAEPGPDGDKIGWERFLEKAGTIFQSYGDIKFVHWASYEKTNVKQYVANYGDPSGIAARVLENLLDLNRVYEDSVILPLPSYSLKVIEKFVGFERTQDEYGGDWAIANYIRAVESNEDDKRREVMEEILKYNQEDLEATWAALIWLRDRAPELCSVCD